MPKKNKKSPLYKVLVYNKNKTINFVLISILFLNLLTFSAFSEENVSTQHEEGIKGITSVRLKISENSSEILFNKNKANSENKNDTFYLEKEREYKLNLSINSLLPGYAQHTINKPEEGNLYLYTSLPLLVIGQGLLIYYFYDKGGIIISPHKRENGLNYLTRFGNEDINDKNFFLYSGLLLSLYGTLISTYSSYAYHRDFIDMNLKSDLKKGRESLGDLILSPIKPENIFNFDFFPMYPLSVVSSITPNDINKMGDFWKKEKVPFMGVNVSPWQGLIFEFLTACLIVSANATWEEIYFRGLELEKNGLNYSSLSFGLAHAGNALYPDASVEETALQTSFATLFGFYAGQKTIENKYDFRKMIALHFWHNVTSATLNYMANPDKGLFFINFSYKF